MKQRPRKLPHTVPAPVRERHVGLRLKHVFALVGHTASLGARTWAVPVSPSRGDGWMLCPVGEGYVGFSRDDPWSCYRLGRAMRGLPPDDPVGSATP